MSPFNHTPNEEVDTLDPSNTRHEAVGLDEDDESDPTSTTHHVSQLISEEEAAVDDKNKNDKEDDLSLRIHKRVADIATKVYRRASAQSDVLSSAKLEDVALIRFDELQVGDFLGKGSFSNVHEITKIELKNNNNKKETNNNVGKERISFNASTARKFLASNYCRDSESGTYRYAIKFLKENVRSSPSKYAAATTDLVTEGMFLANLTHPNIIKVRGLPEGGVQSLTQWHRPKGYFLILDRLFGTLDEKIYEEWVVNHVDKKDRWMGLLRSPQNQQERKANLADRLGVAFDICGALKYLHEKRLIYRDLKPENLGFDVRGDVKLFDLGLVKELHSNKQDRNGNYHMSMAGTPRYMAPEVGNLRPYNLSADVYSLSMLLYEIISLEKPFKIMTYKLLQEDVWRGAVRPPLSNIRHKKMKSLIKKGWSPNAKKRPTMDVMYEEIKKAYCAAAGISESDVSHEKRRSTFLKDRISSMSGSRISSMSTSHVAKKASDAKESEHVEVEQ